MSDCTVCKMTDKQRAKAVEIALTHSADCPHCRSQDIEAAINTDIAIPVMYHIGGSPGNCNSHNTVDNFVCTLKDGHEGPHVAHWECGMYICHWFDK